jgi:broad specificity phosphatase PhoE
VLFLVRHGQSEANARGLLCGRADPPLTEHGRAQAREIAARLPRPDRIVSSPLARARDTAAALAADGPAVEIDPRWLEMDYGRLDGHGASALDAAGWQAWRDDPRHVPAGGESLVDVGARVHPACEELAPHAADADVVVVSHVSPIKAALAWVLGVDVSVAWRMFLRDAAVCRVDTSGSAPVLIV